MIDLPNGLHYGIAPQKYHARELGMVSKSALDLVHRSAAHYKAWIDGAPEEDTPALAFGSAFHCALLEPTRFVHDYAVEPDFGDCRKKDNRDRRDAWREERSGRRPLSAADDRTIRAMVAAVRAHPLAGKMVRDGESEVTVRWTDEETGLPCKSRADYYVAARSMVADVKSCIDASLSGFRKAVASHRYYVQDALYRAGFAAAGAPIRHFVFIAVEKEPPYAIGTYVLDMDGIAKGHDHVRRDIRRLSNAVKGNDFPGYDVGITPLDLPPWAA